MNISKKYFGVLANIRHSAPNSRIELVKQRFAPRLQSEQNSYELNTHSHPISCVLTAGRTEGENTRHPDNRAAQPKQEIQHTLGHERCPACLQAGALVMHIQLSPELRFRDAAVLWLQSRKGIKSATIADYKKCILRLNVFFGDMCLKDIGIGNLAAYQEQRQLKAGASRINHETMTMGQVLKRARLWQPLAEFFEPLPLPKKKRGKALTEQEERRLFEIAAARPKCKVALCVWLITANTTAGWSEISNLRLRNVDLTGNSIHIEEGIKNEFRERTVPLNKQARWAVEQLLQRASGLGANNLEHYLIPERFGDPRKNMSSCKTAWYSLRAELVKEFPHLAKLRQYDLRHHAITKLLENPAISEAVAEEIAGHISHSMKKLYSHPRMDAKREAVMALEGKMAVGA